MTDQSPLTWLIGAPEISATTYTAGDALGGKFLLTPPIAQNTGDIFIVHSVIIRDKDGQNAALDVLFLYDNGLDGGEDDNPFGPTDQELDNIMAHVSALASHYSIFANNSIATIPGIGLILKVFNKTLSIPCQLVTRGTPTHTDTNRINIAVGGLLR